MSDIVKIHKAEIIRDKETAFERLAKLEDSLRADSFDIVSSVMAFADIAKDEQEIPREWIEELGYVKALRKFRLAQAGWMGAKEAPVAIKVAASICGNIIKARAAEITKQPLNMTLVKVTANVNTYDAIEVDE